MLSEPISAADMPTDSSATEIPLSETMKVLVIIIMKYSKTKFLLKIEVFFCASTFTILHNFIYLSGVYRKCSEKLILSRFVRASVNNGQYRRCRNGDKYEQIHRAVAERGSKLTGYKRPEKRAEIQSAAESVACDGA